MSEQYYVHLLLISFSYVNIFPSLSCMLLVFGSIFFVRLLTISNAVLMLFLLMLSSISLHCSSIQFLLALFRPLFIALLISLYLGAPSVVLLSFFSCLRLSNISSKIVRSIRFLARVISNPFSENSNLPSIHYDMLARIYNFFACGIIRHAIKLCYY